MKELSVAGLVWKINCIKADLHVQDFACNPRNFYLETPA